MVYCVDDTIAAVASAAGGSARGVIRLSGPEALACLNHCFDADPANSIPSTQPQCVSGQLRLPEPLSSVSCDAYIWPTLRSYTRQPSVEIHTFGSPPILQAILRTLCEHGARLAEPGEFTLRAFLAGRLDLPQAEAVLGVIDAVSQKQLDLSLQQLAGGLSSQLGELRESLLNLCADIEAGLDFVDEDIEFVSSDEVVARLNSAADELTQLLGQISNRGSASECPRVLLQGRPNAGKSTLWNALMSSELAITSQIPGTTRDYLEGTLLWDGLEFLLIDTAGVDQEPLSQIDSMAREMTFRRTKDADLIIHCVDGELAPTDWDHTAVQEADLAVLTKADSLCQEWQAITTSGTARFPQKDNDELELLLVSCQNDQGVDSLKACIREALLAKMSDESSVVATTAVRCQESLRLANDGIQRASQLATAAAGDELVAAEIRNSLNELGKIVGAIYTDDVLDRVFRRFCIGK